MQKRLLILLLGFVMPVGAGVFEFSGERHGLDVVAHPTGYTGAGGNLIVTVGISPSSPHAAEMVISTKNAINTWNLLVPTVGNVVVRGSGVSQRQFDFESVVLHELGHCIGLAHPNLASESGLTGTNKNFTAATRGLNNRHDINDGADNVIGSFDDIRGDDRNLHWFRIVDNNPFEISGVVDITTYSNSLVDLPTGHRFAANADREVSDLLGFPSTEAVMQQGIFAGETRRILSADDVAILRLGTSGLDMLANTADDYTLALRFVNFTDMADIVLDFDNKASFASCTLSGVFLGRSRSHISMTGGHISFNTNFSWFFNDELTSSLQPEKIVPAVDITANSIPGSIFLEQGDRLILAASLKANDSAGNQADYWVRASTPAGIFWLNNQLQFVRSDAAIRVFGGPVISLSSFIILNESTIGLLPGTYTVTFFVDDNKNSLFDGTFQDTVIITINP